MAQPAALGVRRGRRRSCRRACASGARGRRGAPRRPRAHRARRRAARRSCAARAADVGRLVGQRTPALGERVERPRRRPVTPSSAAPAARQQRLHAGALLGRDRLRAAERRCAQRLEVAQALARGEQLALLGLVRRGVLDLAELEREQVELAVARTRERRQRVELVLGCARRAREPARRPRAALACSAARRTRRAGRAAPRPASAGGARAGRRTTAALGRRLAKVGGGLPSGR